MEPTIGEIIFYVVAIIIVFFSLPLFAKEELTMEITDGQRRDWANREKEWYK